MNDYDDDNRYGAKYQRDTYPDFVNKATEVAAALGEGWRFAPSDFAAYASGMLIGPDYGISVTKESGADRFIFNWGKPREYTPLLVYKDGAKVTVDYICARISRPAPDIAKEIERRLIPQITSAAALYAAELVNDRAYYDKQDAVVGKYKAIDTDGTMIRWAEGQPNAAGFVEDVSCDIRMKELSLRCQLGTSLRVEGYLSHDVGLLLAELIRAERDGKIHQVGIRQTRWEG
jgi:hypothetical protein